MILLSWNILDGGGSRIPGIASAILNYSPDVVVLGEFKNNRSGRELRWLLEKGGLMHQQVATEEAGGKSVLVATRLPLELEDFPEWPLPEHHRVVAGRAVE